MGGARLIPTTQMTLLERFFGGLVPDNMSFRSPTVWESSRFCVDHDLAETRMSSGGKRATIALGIGNLDYAMANGITHFVTVIEERMYELSRNYGTDQSLLSNQTIEGANVICALIPVNERNIELANKMRVFIA
jgi:N-acyl-L-homoserine lactone synthetase